MITLKPFEPADMDRLIGWIDSPEFLLQWAGPIFTYPLDKAQLEQHCKQVDQSNPPSLLIFKAVDSRNDVVGHIELSHIDYLNLSASISRVLVAPNKRGQGLGEHMMIQMLRIAFDQLHLHRIDLRVFDFNAGAIACYEKVGFIKEGLIRDARKMGESYWSLYQYSLLEHEWRQKNNPRSSSVKQNHS
ncbi:GNAT family N-acetyltransferase [Laceyella putida]|uniref:GNAT family N-acetyltransferase n=1 Tax=Laceyella putida TaxID=110101 RepID=A0ABW2RQB3_9BACL